MGENLAADVSKENQDRDLNSGSSGQQKAESFLQGSESLNTQGTSDDKVDTGEMEFLRKRREWRRDRSREQVLHGLKDSPEGLLFQIDKRCEELIPVNRSAILNLEDAKLCRLLFRLRVALAKRLEISWERLNLKFVQTNSGIALRGQIELEGGLMLPLDIGRDGILTFGKPYVLTQQGLKPQSLTNLRFKDDGILVGVSDYLGLRNAFEVVRYVTEQTKGREAVTAVKEEGGVIYALARDQVNRNFYLYKLERVEKDGKIALVASKERVKVEEIEAGETSRIRAKTDSSEVVFRLGRSQVISSSRTSETAEMLFAGEYDK